MDVVRIRVERLAAFAHHNLLWLLVVAYLLAAVAPGPGLWLRSVDLLRIGGSSMPHISLPAALLGFLLFNAGLGIQAHQLLQLARRPLLLIIGVLATSLFPVAFIL